jgi:hypothetical protein
MAIQFHCPGCSQPIEVDDIHAGQTAACPYCRQVVNVPTESSLGQAPPVSARPTAEVDRAWPSEAPDSRPPIGPPALPPQPPSGELHIGPSITPREQLGHNLGRYALICTVLTVVLFGGGLVYGVLQIAPDLWKNPSSRPSEEQLAKLDRNPWLAAAQFGGMFFALVGVVLGVTSLVQSRSSNWRAIVSVVICGLLLLCTCGGVVLSGATGLGAGT